MKPKIKVADLAKALQGIETDRQLTKEIVEDALKEALTKAYRKHIEIPDAYVRASKLITNVISSMSIPRATISVATNTSIWPLLNLNMISSRSC